MTNRNLFMVSVTTILMVAHNCETGCAMNRPFENGAIGVSKNLYENDEWSARNARRERLSSMFKERDKKKNNLSAELKNSDYANDPNDITKIIKIDEQEKLNTIEDLEWSDEYACLSYTNAQKYSCADEDKYLNNCDENAVSSQPETDCDSSSSKK